MTVADGLRETVLDLGLEDLIPLPELMQTVVERFDDYHSAVRAVAQVLGELVADDRVRIYRGPWQDPDPPRITAADALELLRDEKWYRFRIDEPDEERLQYINVANLREP